MQVSSATDASEPLSQVDFTSRNEDRLSVTEAPIITPGDIVALPKGQAFALLEGGQLWKVRMPLPDPRRDPAMPESLAVITADMAHRYHTEASGWSTPPVPAQAIPPRHTVDPGVGAQDDYGAAEETTAGDAPDLAEVLPDVGSISEDGTAEGLDAGGAQHGAEDD